MDATEAKTEPAEKAREQAKKPGPKAKAVDSAEPQGSSPLPKQEAPASQSSLAKNSDIKAKAFPSADSNSALPPLKQGVSESQSSLKNSGINVSAFPSADSNSALPMLKQEASASQSSLVKKKPQAKRKSRKWDIYAKAKRKTAVARAVIRKGKGRVTINNRLIDVLQPAYARTLISEPLKIAGDACRDVDIDVNVHGGGFMGQAISARGAIAKALVEYTNDDKLKQRMLAHDRMLLVDDVRQVEPKKPLGPKARRKKQKSKR